MFMLNLNAWPDLQQIGWIEYMLQDNQKNVNVINTFFDLKMQARNNDEMFYGDGHAAGKIVDLIENYIDNILYE